LLECVTVIQRLPTSQSALEEELTVVRAYLFRHRIAAPG